MIESVGDFEQLLNQLNPEDDDFVLQIDELVEQLSDSIAAEVYPVIFAFFEKHPDSDCYAPGTLVHLVEDYYPNYVPTLLKSERAKPSYNATLMLNRILNSDLPDSQRSDILCILHSVAINDALSEVVRDMAKWSIEHQAQCEA